MSLHRFQIISYVGVFMFFFSILMQMVIFPLSQKFLMKRQVALKNGWPMRDIWSKLPFVIENHVYVFNVTNPVEIGIGAKPIVQEVGPFVYDIYQEKTNQIDHEEDDTVSYVLKNVYHYNQKKSKGLSDEVEIYFPHLFIMTAANGILKENPPLVSWTSRSVDTVLNSPESLFYKVKVKTALFDGFSIPCGGVEEFFGKLICNLLRDRYFDFTLRKRDETFYTSMFGFLNGTYDKQDRIRINRGVKNLKNLGKVVKLNDKSNISIWKDDQCDTFEGTDGSIFPPYLDKNGKDNISFVNQLLCRKFRATYDSNVEFKGLKLLRYTVDMGTDGDHVAEEKCYCIKPDGCLKKGMFEMFRCINIPVIASNPHFYLADPYYLTTVDTLNPNKKKHLAYVDFDPLTGSPVRAHLRVQFNMELIKIDKFRMMRNYTYAMLPMVWIDLVLILPDSLVDEIKRAQRTIMQVKILEYTMMFGGLIMCALARYLESKTKNLTKVQLEPRARPKNATANLKKPRGPTDGVFSISALPNIE